MAGSAEGEEIIRTLSQMVSKLVGTSAHWDLEGPARKDSLRCSKHKHGEKSSKFNPFNSNIGSMFYYTRVCIIMIDVPCRVK